MHLISIMDEREKSKLESTAAIMENVVFVCDDIKKRTIKKRHITNLFELKQTLSTKSESEGNL